jgi:hypothetical protein
MGFYVLLCTTSNSVVDAEKKGRYCTTSRHTFSKELSKRQHRLITNSAISYLITNSVLPKNMYDLKAFQ